MKLTGVWMMRMMMERLVIPIHALLDRLQGNENSK